MARPKNYFVVLDDDTSVPPIIEKATGVAIVSFLSIEAIKPELDGLRPDAVFVDVHLSPTETGLDVLPLLREQWGCPIFVITSDTSEEFIKRALELGADDFIRKPLSLLEVQSRFKKRWEERKQQEAKNTVSFGNSKLDRLNRKLVGPKATEFLSPTEVNLLQFFIDSNGRLLQRDELKKKGWVGIAVSDKAMEKKIFDLRKTLESVGSNRHIVTHYRKGYALSENLMPDMAEPKLAKA